MKRIVIYIMAASVALLVPVKRTDVGKLIPVEVVCISDDKERIRIETNMGNCGEGQTLEEAFQELEASAAGVVFLDTASYLLLRGSADHLCDKLDAYLKPWVRVCFAAGEIDLTQTPNYLDTHRPKTRLFQTAAGIPEVLRGENGVMKIVEKR